MFDNRISFQGGQHQPTLNQVGGGHQIMIMIIIMNNIFYDHSYYYDYDYYYYGYYYY